MVIDNRRCIRNGQSVMWRRKLFRNCFLTKNYILWMVLRRTLLPVSSYRPFQVNFLIYYLSTQFETVEGENNCR